MNRALLLLLSMLLAACASKPRTEAARFNIDPQTCKASIADVAALPVTRVAAYKDRFPKSLRFEKVATCLRSDNGGALPLVLMDLGPPAALEVQVNLIMRSEVVLAAAIDLLDAERRLIRSVPFERFVRRGGAYSGSIFLNEKDADVRYLVLRPDPDAVGGKNESISGVAQTFSAVFVSGGTLYAVNSVTRSEAVLRNWLSEIGDFQVRAVQQ